MLEPYAYIIVFSCALSLSLLTIPLARFLSVRFGITSIPGGRRQEQLAMPKLGGLAIFVGFTFTVVLAQLLPVLRTDPYEINRLVGLVFGGLVIFILGVIDDALDLNYYQIFAIQILTAVIAIAFQIFIEFFNNPFTGIKTDPWAPVVTVALTMFWLVLMMNTVNLLDGSDGLAGGIAFIAALVLFLNSAFRLEPPQTSVSLLHLSFARGGPGFSDSQLLSSAHLCRRQRLVSRLRAGLSQHHRRRQNGDHTFSDGFATHGLGLASGKPRQDRQQPISRRSRAFAFSVA